MPTKYFVVKHDLASLRVLPEYVWRTDCGKSTPPHRFNELTVGSKWVSYAYKKSDSSSERLRYVTGFSSCIEIAQYSQIPLPRSVLDTLDPRCPSKAWLIKGAPEGKKLENPVLVPSIDFFYDTPKFSRQAVTPITPREYRQIHEYVVRHQLAPTGIPALGREPESEQEVLAVFMKTYESLGVSRILRVRQGFPDLEVQLKGSSKTVKIELELYAQNFISHGHPRAKDVAVLCWLNDDPRTQGKRVKDRVHKIYELRSLLQDPKGKILW
jgi:hypothetical protein